MTSKIVGTVWSSLEVEATTETTRAWEGDNGKTVLRLKDHDGCTCWGIIVTERNGEKHTIHLAELELHLTGHSEAYSLIEALKFAVESLEQKRKNNEVIPSEP